MLRLCQLAMVASVFTSASLHASPSDECAEQAYRLDTEAYLNVTSREALIDLLLTTIQASYEADGNIDLECIVRSFRQLGDNAAVRIIDLSPDNAERTIRFTITNYTWRDLLPQPGGPNGKYLAVVRQESDGRITLLTVTGEPKWQR